MVKWRGVATIKAKIFEDLPTKQHLLSEFGANGGIRIKKPL